MPCSLKGGSAATSRNGDGASKGSHHHVDPAALENALEVPRFTREQDKQRLRAAWLLSPGFAPDDPGRDQVATSRGGDFDPGWPVGKFSDEELKLAMERSASEAEELANNVFEHDVETARAETRQAALAAEQAEQNSFEKAIRESFLSAPFLPDSFDNPDIFESALQASRVDLGPKGVSQPARIFAMMADENGFPKQSPAEVYLHTAEDSSDYRVADGACPPVPLIFQRPSSRKLSKCLPIGSACSGAAAAEAAASVSTRRPSTADSSRRRRTLVSDCSQTKEQCAAFSNARTVEPARGAPSEKCRPTINDTASPDDDTHVEIKRGEIGSSSGLTPLSIDAMRSSTRAAGVIAAGRKIAINLQPLALSARTSAPKRQGQTPKSASIVSGRCRRLPYGRQL